MIYTLSWLPSVTLLGVVMLFLIVTVLAVAAAVVAQRPELAPRPAPLVKPRLHRAR